MIDPKDNAYLWIVIVGFIIAFILAFGIGANDVANSFGTSVGSKVLTLLQACIVASIFELAGAILIGSKVTDTIRKGIIKIDSFNGTEQLAMAGALSALTGTSVWLLIATFLNLPVSGTHSIVGATIGYALVALGKSGIIWIELGKIAASWVISPLLSGIISSLIFTGIDKFILKSADPLISGLFSLPFMLGATLLINLFSIVYSNSDAFGLKMFCWWHILLMCLGVALLCAILVRVFFNPWLKRKIISADEAKASYQFTNTKEKVLFDNSGVELTFAGSKERSHSTRSVVSYVADIMVQPKETEQLNHDDPCSAQLFKYLQILTATFGSFAHGGNDVSNAIGPLISLWLIYETGKVSGKAQTPIWILLFGGVGIVIGLCVWGRRVIKTIGENLTPITPSSGFAIEIGSALTVLLASNLGIPISTTHCKVGSIVMVGRVRSREVVDWSLFGGIVISWIVTMPITGGISAGVFAIVRAAIK
ncbi:sodium-dependent phosphate transporter 2 [Hydra vulgaris]|uniref:Phosphate transporter n=1 Tax=Hydra vulgaris TaxID=6087 RepID=T2MDX7_HYDVU|nr:sodium-dependent phosphate transporter 2-like [Hydra vulgaris]XP_047144901.1 sodium-dependent phosphate transporter 2-like [Hydra vulgaris]